jgi:hypothetical protein
MEPWGVPGGLLSIGKLGSLMGWSAAFRVARDPPLEDLSGVLTGRFGDFVAVEIQETSSVITLKPAIRYQFKTGQRDWPET